MRQHDRACSECFLASTKAECMTYINQRRRLAAVMSALILNVTSPHAQARDVPSVDEIQIETGVIFSERVSEKNGLCRRPVSCWTPTPNDVARLEKKLQRYLATAEAPIARRISTTLAAYKRKYFGYMIGRDRWITLIGICSTRWNWESTAFQTLRPPSTDMEECYFSADFNVTNGEFKHLYIDGYSS